MGALQEGLEAEQYEQLSAWLQKEVALRLPPCWSFDGKRLLDFGCGAGRVLRGFVDEASVCEFFGCDIHEPSIDWLRRNLCPPFRVFCNDEMPPLPFETGSLDLIYAVSVFTHLTDSWAPWLLELRRCLAEDGTLIASLMGGGMSEAIAGRAWEPDRVGMDVLGADESWDRGGPMVLHSPWWVRAHWGRAFDIVSYDEATASAAHDWVVLRPKGGQAEVADLETPEPNEPRELSAESARRPRHMRPARLAGRGARLRSLAARFRGGIGS